MHLLATAYLDHHTGKKGQLQFAWQFGGTRVGVLQLAWGTWFSFPPRSLSQSQMIFYLRQPRYVALPCHRRYKFVGLVGVISICLSAAWKTRFPSRKLKRQKQKPATNPSQRHVLTLCTITKSAQKPDLLTPHSTNFHKACNF